MKRYHADNGIPTLNTALSEYMNVNELKKLARLTDSRVPTRKAELIEHIVRHLEGDRLRTVWQCMDELQRAAVAEVVHSGGTTFHSDRFRAKYRRDPAWGSSNAYRRDKRGQENYLPIDFQRDDFDLSSFSPSQFFTEM